MTTVLCAVVVALALVPRMMSSWLDRPTRDALTPDVTLRLANGTELPLRSLRGRVVVLDFWGREQHARLLSDLGPGALLDASPSHLEDRPRVSLVCR